ncbi:hypothetical protein NDU88_011486 [Pleurodeles waltl]|uniref:Uncharacterized protein n=1 Tax=Pleurodeles waltl TaxID=8319 RepID=A0AAV7R152_PLEWA|nr:hypothetical protein NDU88_011486 [Pleurodeles waltl]
MALAGGPWRCAASPISVNKGRPYSAEPQGATSDEDSWGGDLPVVPDLEQRIQELRSVLQWAAVLFDAGRCSGPDAPDSPSSDGESSVASWPSVHSSHVPPDITPQTDNII